MSCSLVELALGARSAPELESAVLDHLQRRVGMDVAFFLGPRPSASPTTVGLDPGRLARFVASYDRHAHEVLPVKHAALGARGVAVDTDVLGASGVRATAYHRELAAPLGGRHSLIAYLRLRGEVIGCVMLGRCGAAFHERDVRAVEDALPIITLASASFGAARPDPPAGLTARERDVLDYLCLGYNNREIAHACGTSPNTVRNQLASVFHKLGATTRAEAVALARR